MSYSYELRVDSKDVNMPIIGDEGELLTMEQAA